MEITFFILKESEEKKTQAIEPQSAMKHTRALS